MTGKMFPFITATWNPIGGECPHECTYCWAKAIIKRNPNMTKYHGKYTIDEKQINKKFTPYSFVFVCDMIDLFAANVPIAAINMVINRIIQQPNVTFLILTKNPRYAWLMDVPKNVVIGATIESNLDYPVSKAPKQADRLKAMQDITDNRKMLSIEPIMDFDLEPFVNEIVKAKPEFVAVGYDNYKNGLTEPSFSKTLHLIAMLEGAGIKVYRKTIRDPIQFIVKEGSTKQ